MSKIFTATTFAILCSATALPAQWTYNAGSIERHPMTDEIIRENPAMASITFRVDQPERGRIIMNMICLGSGKPRLGIRFAPLYDGRHLLGVRAGELLQVRFRFDDNPVTSWRRWKMYNVRGGLRGVKVVPKEGVFSIERFRHSRRMLVEIRNTRTRESMVLSDDNTSHGSLRGSNAAIGRLVCVT